jgi:hypothetical protein
MLDRTDHPATIAPDDLAQRIDAEHHAVATALQSALAHAISAGEMLIEAKRQFGQHGRWLPWLRANCAVPPRTARHYMALARKRKHLCDQNGNVLPISVHDAVERLKPLRERPGANPGEEREDDWEFPEPGTWIRHCRQSWGERFSRALETAVLITKCRPPEPRYVVKAVREGKTPGLTAEAIRSAIALLTRYADALEAQD